VEEPSPTGGGNTILAVENGQLVRKDLAGNTTPLASNVNTSGPNAGPVALSVDSIVAYGGTDGRIYTIPLDGGQEPRPLTNADEGENFQPSWSPDGNTIVFVSTRDNNPEIYAIDANGANPRRLTNSSADDRYPSFSPDGNNIFFQSNRTDAWKLYVMPSNGEIQGAPAQFALVDDPFAQDQSVDDQHPRVAPDGLKIAYVRTGGNQPGVWIAFFDKSRTPIANIPPTLDGPAWSPNSLFVATFDQNNGGRYVIDLTTNPSPVRRVSGTDGERWPTWWR
jgi:TolB protein